MSEDKQFDLDELENVDSEYVDLNESERVASQKKKEKKKKQKKEKAQNKRSFANVALTSILPAVLAAGIGVFVGMVFLGSDSSSDSEVGTIKQIKGKTALSARVDSIKDSELLALRAQMSTMTDEFESGSYSGEENFINTQVTGERLVAIDEFMGAILNDASNDSNALLAAVRPHFSVSTEPTDRQPGTPVDSEVQVVEDNLNALVQGRSLAKDLNTQTAKVGVAMPAIMFYGANDTAVYQVISPVVTSDARSFNVIYLVKLDSSHNVVSASYAGYVENNSDVSSYFALLETHLASLRQLAEQRDNGDSTTGSTVEIENLPQQAPAEENTEEKTEASESSE